MDFLSQFYHKRSVVNSVWRGAVRGVEMPHNPSDQVSHEMQFLKHKPNASMRCIRTGFSSRVYADMTPGFVFPEKKHFETSWLITVQPKW